MDIPKPGLKRGFIYSVQIQNIEHLPQEKESFSASTYHILLVFLGSFFISFRKKSSSHTIVAAALLPRLRFLSTSSKVSAGRVSVGRKTTVPNLITRIRVSTLKRPYSALDVYIQCIYTHFCFLLSSSRKLF